MQLEAGKFYKTRDGRKVGPMEIGENGIAICNKPYSCVYADTGRGNQPNGRDMPSDIVALWADSPIREVTRKEIVPGVYGRLSVNESGHGKGFVNVKFVDTRGAYCAQPALTATELTAAIATLTTIRDALAEVA